MLVRVVGCVWGLVFVGYFGGGCDNVVCGDVEWCFGCVGVEVEK